MFIFDVIIYAIFAIIMSAFASMSLRHDPSGKWNRYLTYFVGFFTLICAVRWNVGVDCLSYVYSFISGKGSGRDEEALWLVFTNFFSDNGIHWTIGMGVIAFVQILFLTLALRKYQYILVMLPFVLFGGRYWMDITGLMRQMTVACVFVWATWYVVDKKWIKYVIFIIIANFIHSSAILLLPVIFMPKSFNVCNKRMLLLGIFIACLIIGQTPQFAWFGKYISFFYDVTNNPNAGSMYQMLTKGYVKEALSYGPMMISYIAIPIFLIWFGPKLSEKYSKSLPTFNIWFNLAYLYGCLYFLVCNISHIFIRPVQYLELIQMVMAALLLHYLWTEYRKHKRHQLATFFFCAVIATNTFWDVYKAVDAGKSWEISTYKLYFTHRDQARAIGFER